MPICENCHNDVQATLEIQLPEKMRKNRNFKGRQKAKLCFYCIRLYARTSLRFEGYWHSIVFPHQHGKERKK